MILKIFLLNSQELDAEWREEQRPRSSMFARLCDSDCEAPRLLGTKNVDHNLWALNDGWQSNW